MQDQRFERKMKIGGVDKVLTQQIQKTHARTLLENNRKANLETFGPSTSGTQVNKNQDNDLPTDTKSDKTTTEEEPESSSMDEEYECSHIKKR